MKYLISSLFAAALLIQAGVCRAQQSETFGRYTVHYNVINANLLPAQVAKGYGIQRSSSRALVNITVVDTEQGDSGTALHAKVDTSATNLTGQRREVKMREIVDPDGAIYYIGELPVNNLETCDFTVKVKIESEPKPFELTFRQQFFTE
jgi:hypothetical protein